MTEDEREEKLKTINMEITVIHAVKNLVIFALASMLAFLVWQLWEATSPPF